MKKKVAILLITALVFLLAGCFVSRSEDGDASSEINNIPKKSGNTSSSSPVGSPAIKFQNTSRESISTTTKIETNK